MTSQTLSSLPLPRASRLRGNVLARLAQRLIEADARVRERRRLEDLPDWLREDAGLPPRQHTERTMLYLYLQAGLLR
jgi:hypothetical protein